jgi:hypothetical protein
MKRNAWLIALAMATASPCAAQTQQVASTPPDYPRGKISGLAFGDYYYNLDGNPNHGYNSSGADTIGQAYIDGVKPISQDLNGFAFRRIFFQLDNDFSVRYSTRFRLEADGKSLTSDGKVGVAVRSAYVQAKSIVPRGNFFVGVITPPTWLNSEEFWAYRSIEKTIGDFRGLGVGSDFGAALQGFADNAHHVGYLAMVGNGFGQKPENNRYKKAYLGLPLQVGDLRVEPYADYEGGSGGTDKATYKVFAGYEFKRAAVGFEWIDRVNHRPTGGNQEPTGYSFFVRGNPLRTLAGYARLDLWSPDRRADNRVDQTMYIFGLDWQPIKDIHFMPNVEGIQYTAKGTAVAPAYHDLQARITFYYVFSKPQS